MIERIQFGDPPLDNHLFEINLTSLKNHLSKSVDFKSSLSEKITTINSNAGQPTVQYEGNLLHSKYDPNKEGIDFAKNIKSGSRIFLYGFGLGYHLEPLLEKIGPDGFLLVAELNPDILTAAMKLKNQTQLFGKYPAGKSGPAESSYGLHWRQKLTFWAENRLLS